MATRRVGEYDHLNKDSKIEITLDIEELVERVERMNYGTHRFLSALVRVRRENRAAIVNRDKVPECKMLTDGIEDLLNRGGF